MKAANDTINRVEQGRFNIGTTTEDALLQTEAELLTAQSNAQQARLDVQSRTLNLRNFIGLTDNVDLELVVPEDVPDFLIEYEDALKYAKENRAEFLDFQIDKLNAERQVAEARAQRFNAFVSASFGYNSAQSNELNGVYDPDNIAAGGTFRLNFTMPILDGGRNKARMNSALERQKLTTFSIEQERINFEQEIENAST